MIDNSNKKLKSITPYLAFFDFSKLNNKSVVLKENADVFDTLRTIKKVVSETLEQTQKIANHLQSSDLHQTLKNNWDFVYQHIAYEIDKNGVEQVRTPLRLVNDKKGDCDCFSTFLSSLLTNQNIPHSLRMTEYDHKGYYQHVYIIVPNKTGYYTLDCVVDKFNKEVPFTKKYDMQMTMLNGLNGLGSTSLGFGEEFSTMNGLGSLPLDNPELATGEQLEDDFLNRMKSHLISTIQTLKIQPQLTEEQSSFVEKLNYLISNWDNKTAREKALDELEKIEGLQGLGGFFSSIKSGLKQAGNWVKNTTVSNFNVAKNVASKIGTGLKKVGQTILKYNPLTIAIRNGFLLAVKFNLFNLGSYMGWGYISDEQAKKYNLDLDELNHARSNFDRARKMFVDNLQGTDSALRSAAQQGFEKAMKKSKQDIRINGLGEPVTAATVSAASAFIAKVLLFLKNIDLGKLLKNVSGGVEIVKSLKSQDSSQDVSQDPQEFQKQLEQYNFSQGAEGSVAIKDKEDNTKMWLIGGGILVAGLLLINNNKKQRPLSGTRKTTTRKKPVSRKTSRRTATTRKVKLNI